MQYLLLIYDDERNGPEPGSEPFQEMMAGYFAFNEELKAAGKMLGGEALHPVATASSVRSRDGKTLVTDGPFAETKEQLGGFYFIEADSMEEAQQWAAKIPAVTTGTVEVRPVMIIPGDG